MIPLTSKRNVTMLLILAHLIALGGFAVLGDLTQLFVQFPRSVTMMVWDFRIELMVLGLSIFGLALFFSIQNRYLSKTILAVNIIAFSGLFFSGYINVPYFMFQTQQDTAKYVSIQEAQKYLNQNEKVMVIEVNGDARAFPHNWIAQPHVAGDIIGGEEITLAYCSLSHLGTAYRPYANDQKLDLKVMLQLENNLVLFDENTNVPIQQIYGRLERSEARLSKYPTQVMSLAAFEHIYPEGRVFFNPVENLWDKIVRGMVLDVTHRQYTEDEPAFPTMKHMDSRLHPKEQIYGVVIGDDTIAYTKGFLERNPIINTTIGGKDVVIVYYAEFDTVAGFSRILDGQIMTVTEIDVQGNIAAGKLDRIPVDSEVLWMIWSNFYPDTDLKN